MAIAALGAERQSGGRMNDQLVNDAAGCGSLTLLLSPLLLIGLGSPAFAQATLEEIVVTAQKREQSIQDVGIAITAFSGEQIRQLGFTQSVDLTRLAPGVHMSGSAAGQVAQISIRGVTQNDYNDQTEPPVAVYVDEGYVAFGQGQLFGLFDIEHVEILRGPQGTLFGRNATGGLVHYLSRRPTTELEGYLDATYGSYDSVRIETAISGSLTDALSGRLAAMYDRFDEILENDYPVNAATVGPLFPGGGEDSYNDDTRGVRGQLLFEPNDALEVLVIGAYGRSHLSDAPYMDRATVAVVDAQGRQINAILASPSETREMIGPGGIGLDNPFSFDADTERPVPGGNLYGASCNQQNYDDFSCSRDFAYEDINRLETRSATAKLTWNLDSLTVTAITDYKDYSKFIATEGDGGSAAIHTILFDADVDTFTQELRLNGELERMRWVTGLYYLTIDNRADTGAAHRFNTNWVPFAGTTAAHTTNTDTESISAFGQAEFDLTDTLTLIGGVRATQENKDYDLEEALYLNTDDKKLTLDTKLAVLRPFTEYDLDATLWSGKVQLDWKPTDELLVYGGISRGAKAGGFNSPFTFGGPFPDEDIPYGDEALLAYETGFKADLFGGAARLNGSLYYYEYDDYQGFTFAGGSGGFVQNVDAIYKGAEIELQASPWKGWNLLLNAAYLDAEVQNVEVADDLFRDTRPSFAPEVEVAAVARYEFPWSLLSGRFSVQADYSYASDFYDNIRNFAASKLPSYSLANARVAWRSDGGRWDASLFVNNLADERYVAIGFDSALTYGSNAWYFGKPRWYGGSIRYSF
jgi:iron complex outermembrane recepter protein